MVQKSLTFLMYVGISIAQTQQFDWVTQIRNKPIYDSREYAWSRSSGTTSGPNGISGNLSSAGNKTISFNGCPAGVLNGKSENAHDLYISGGTGGAERVTISATTCTATGSPGTINFTTANGHTGSWKIATATDGAQEAAYVLSKLQNGGGVFIGRSANYYGTVYVPDYTAFNGAGRFVTVITMNTGGIPVFKVVKNFFLISKLSINYYQDNYRATAGSVGIETHYRTGDATKNGFAGIIDQINVKGFYYGVWIDGTAGSIDLTQVQAELNVSHGFWAQSAQGYWTIIQANGNKGDGIRVTPTSPVQGVPPFFSKIQTYANGGWGIYCQNSGITIIDFFLNNDSQGEFYLDADTLDAGYISNGNIQYAGVNPLNLAPVVNTAPGIRFSDATKRFTVNQVHFFNINGNVIDGGASQQNTFFGNLLQGAGLGGVTGNNFCIKITGATNRFINNQCADPASISGSNNVITNNSFLVTHTLPALEVGAGTRVTVSNNQMANFGTGREFKVGTGVELTDGTNSIYDNRYDYAGTRSVSGIANNPPGFTARYKAQITPCTDYGTCIEGQAYWCIDCLAGNDCPVGSAGTTGSIAVYNKVNTRWICK